MTKKIPGPKISPCFFEINFPIWRYFLRVFHVSDNALHVWKYTIRQNRQQTLVMLSTNSSPSLVCSRLWTESPIDKWRPTCTLLSVLHYVQHWHLGLRLLHVHIHVCGEHACVWTWVWEWHWLLSLVTFRLVYWVRISHLYPELTKSGWYNEPACTVGLLCLSHVLGLQVGQWLQWTITQYHHTED